MCHNSEGTFHSGYLILLFFIISIKMSNLYHPQSILQMSKFLSELKREYGHISCSNKQNQHFQYIFSHYLLLFLHLQNLSPDILRDALLDGVSYVLPNKDQHGRYVMVQRDGGYKTTLQCTFVVKMLFTDTGK